MKPGKKIILASLSVFALIVLSNSISFQPLNKLMNAKQVKKIPDNNSNQQFKVGKLIGSLPFGAKVISPGSNYYYFNGLYYRPCKSGYISVKAPRSIRVSSILAVSERLDSETGIYYCYGTFYK